MPFTKVHKRRNIVARQATTTTAHAATTSATSAVHNVQAPTGPPPFTSASGSGSSSTGTGTGTGTGTSGTLTSTGTSASQTSTQTNAAPTSNGAVQATQATSANALTHTTGSRTVTTRVTGTSSTASPTTTGDSSGSNLGSIAGAALGAVVAIGIVAAIVIWFIRKRKRNSDPDEEPFNRHSFLRQSVAIPDEGPVPSRTRASPPPPPMAERQPMYGSTQTFDNAPNAFGYNTQPSYSAGQLYAPNAANPFGPGGAPATPLPASPGFGTAYEQPAFNNGGYSDLTRGSAVQDFPPSPHFNGPMSPPLDNPHSPNYPGPETFPVPHDNHAPGPEPVNGMYAQPGFPELTPATASAQQGHVVAVSASVHDGRETPVQLGFAPVQMPNPPANQTQAAQPGEKGKKRPDTMYDDDDAYGGI